MKARRILFFLTVVCLLCVGTLAAFAFLPLDSLDGQWTDTETLIEIEVRAEEHWETIAAGDGLQRSFPAMKQRPENPPSVAKVELGRLLYFDPVLSGDNTISCAHCHHPDLGFSDARGRSMGRHGTGVGPERDGGEVLRRGSPTVWNSAFNHLQFWDGRARDLEEQAEKPIQDPAEMGQDPEELEKELAAIPEYVALFGEAFGDDLPTPEAALTVDGAGAVSFENATFAIAAFERTLLSQNSAFDRYARGERAALSESARRGLNLFRSLKTRCFECHNVPTFANRDFKVIGVPDPPDLDAPDLGRGEIVDGEHHAGAFKVPTLRNVALTAPYMHNGAFATLEEVLDFYAGGGGRGLGLEVPHLDDKIRPFPLSAEEKQDLVAFLHSLTDVSAKPAIPERVPSGLPPVVALEEKLPAASTSNAERTTSEIRRDGDRLFVEPGDRIQDALDLARFGDEVIVAPGVYHETLTFDVSGVVLRGDVQGDERPVLDGRGVLTDAIIGSSNDLLIEGFDLRDYTANGVMINLGESIVFRDLRVYDTGLYGLYPVEVADLLIENCEVTGARDAGIYVGQSRDIVVRDNLTYSNVTGIEIENSENALVENNEVFDNTGGILVFTLPSVPSKVGRKVRVVGNQVYGNNHENFADPSAIVASVPAGTGILILAADDVEVSGNEVRDNDSFGIGVGGLDLLFEPGTRYDVDPNPERALIFGNDVADNGVNPSPLLTDLGLPGADLLWDLSGGGHSWDQPGASRLPYVLPGPDWSPTFRRINARIWRLLSGLG